MSQNWPVLPDDSGWIEEGWRELAASERIPGYRLLQRIGAGGQGTVFRAVQESTGRAVALKIVHRTRVSGGAFARFRRECGLVCQLKHPNLVTVHDAGVWEDRQFLAMELVEGPQLDLWLEGPGATTSREARVRLFLGLCEGVAAAHRQGVIHRDLKPQNVLLQPLPGLESAWLPKIADFGLARSLDGEDAFFTTRDERDRLATFAYSAPEMLGSGGDSPDTRTDVFGLGALLYRMLSGSEPRARLSMEEACRTSGPPPYAGISRADAGDRAVGSDLEAIAFQAMAPAPEDRYATVEELATDLRRFLSGRPVAARPRSLRYVLGKSLVRHRTAWALGTAVAVTAIAGTIAWVYQSGRTQEEILRLAETRSAHTASIDDLLQRLIRPLAQREDSGAEAIAVTREVLRDRERMLREDPNNSWHVNSLVGFHELLGGLLLDASQPLEAETEFRAARGLLAGLGRAGSDPAHARRLDELDALRVDALLAAGRPIEARAVLQPVLASCRRRAAEHGGHALAATFAVDVGRCLGRSADAANRSEEAAATTASAAILKTLNEFPALYAAVGGDAASELDLVAAELSILSHARALAERAGDDWQGLTAELASHTRDLSDHVSRWHRYMIGAMMNEKANTDGPDSAEDEAGLLAAWAVLLRHSSSSVLKAEKARFLLDRASALELVVVRHQDRRSWLQEATQLWDELSKGEPDRFYDPQRHARTLVFYAHEIDADVRDSGLRSDDPTMESELRLLATQFVRARTLVAAAPLSPRSVQREERRIKDMLARWLEQEHSAAFARAAGDFILFLDVRARAAARG